MMIHDLDMARFLLGEEPVEVHAVGSCLVDPAIGAAGDVDTAAVLLKTASGKIAQISNSRRATYGYDQRIEVHGSLGLLAAGNQHATTVEHAGADGYHSDPALPFFLERYAEAYRLELDAFVTCVLDGAPIAPSGEDGLQARSCWPTRRPGRQDRPARCASRHERHRRNSTTPHAACAVAREAGAVARKAFAQRRSAGARLQGAAGLRPGIRRARSSA